MIYPSSHTFFLLGSIVVLNGINWVAFEILATTARDNRAIRVLDGLFQSLGTICMIFVICLMHLLMILAIRGGGFEVVNFLRLPQPMMLLYGKPHIPTQLEHITNIHVSNYDG